MRSAAPARLRPSARSALRAAFVAVLLLAGALFVGNHAVLTVESTADGESAAERGPTVVAEQSGGLTVYGPNETKLYEDDDYLRYWDVDPSPLGDRTLLYSATRWVPSSECDGGKCRRNTVGRLNLTTGVRGELFTRVYPVDGSFQWHDVDRVNDTHVAVAGIREDRVFVADVTADRVTWQWNASDHYPSDVGGREGDWTHLNDVEVLADGRIAASVRNMDEVVFVDPETGVDDDWTLGEDDDYDVLYEQHNPDYIPEERGGPAVLVADSHNDRIVEYQRANGEWRQTWEWTDALLQWPRDGDRLPNGHTLITDTNGNRVLEVDRSGEIVWAVETSKAYEAERLGTGDESSGGRSALALGLPSDAAAGPAEASRSSVLLRNVWRTFSDLAPAFVLNSALFVLPPWIRPVQFLPILAAGLTVVAWAGCELYWRFGVPFSGE